MLTSPCFSSSRPFCIASDRTWLTPWRRASPKRMSRCVLLGQALADGPAAVCLAPLGAKLRGAEWEDHPPAGSWLCPPTACAPCGPWGLCAWWASGGLSQLETSSPCSSWPSCLPAYSVPSPLAWSQWKIPSQVPLGALAPPAALLAAPACAPALGIEWRGRAVE